MTTLREAAQQALEAMLNFPDDISDEMFESISALKAGLAQQAEPAQEQDVELSAALGWPGGISDPVLDRTRLLQMVAALRLVAQQALEALEWISLCYVGDDDDAGECASCHERSYVPHAPDCKKNNAITALRAALAQRDQPQGCATEEECTYQPWCRICGTCQRKQAEPVQPFGYWFPDKHPEGVCSGWFVRSPCDGKLDGKPGVPLYTAPPQRKLVPLTEEEIDKIFKHLCNTVGASYKTIARAVEKASWGKNHG